MSNFRQYVSLSRRSISHIIRQPAMVVPSLVFPLIFLAMSSAALDRSTTIPGFPEVGSFAQFAITATIIQGILFGAVMAGTDMARDIEEGFFERLIAAPIARTSIVIGRVAGSALLGLIQAWMFMIVALIFGMTIEGGLVAMALLSLAASLLAAGIASVTVAMGLRTGSSEAVQGSFPLIFVMLFMSSAFFPRDLMEGWFKAVATANPLSHVIEGLREQVIVGVDVSYWLSSLAIAGAIFVLGISLALLALNGRLKASHG